MNALPAERFAEQLKPLDDKLAKLHFIGQWVADKQLESFKGGPLPQAGVPHLWKWDDVYRFLLEAVDAMPEGMTARRNISYLNPELTRGSTHTLSMGVQLITPGENAWAHRHSMNAMRFIIKGNPKAYTVVDGVKCPMEDNDLIVTPAWTWHDHHNPSDHSITWADILDVTIAVRLNQGFYETQEATAQDMRNDAIQPQADFVQPLGGADRARKYSRLHFPWREVYPKLKEMGGNAGSPTDGIILEYIDPKTSLSPFKTMQCCIQMLRPGEETKPHRHSSSACYWVVGGEGTTVIDGKEYNWGQYDGFALPNWLWHHHINRSNKEAAFLFSVTDVPAIQSLGYYVEEDEKGRRIQ